MSKVESNYTINSPAVKEYAVRLSPRNEKGKNPNKSALRLRMALTLLRLKHEVLPEHNGEVMLSAAQLARMMFDDYGTSSASTRRAFEETVLKVGTVLTDMSSRTDSEVPIAIVKVTAAAAELWCDASSQTTIEEYMEKMRPGLKFNMFYVCENKNGLIFEAYMQMQNANAKGKLNTNTRRKDGFSSNGVLSLATAREGDRIFRVIRPLISAQFASNERKKIREQQKRLVVGA